MEAKEDIKPEISNMLEEPVQILLPEEDKSKEIIISEIYQKIQCLNAIYAEFDSYFVRLKPLVENTEKDAIESLKIYLQKYIEYLKDIKLIKQEDSSFLFEKIDSNTNLMGDNLKEFKKLLTKNIESVNIEYIMFLTHILISLDITIEHLYNIYNSFDLSTTEYSTSMSRSYILETDAILFDVKKKYDIFKKKNNTLNSSIISNLTAKLLQNITPDNIKLIHNLFMENTNSIHLYASIMQKLLNSEYKFIIFEHIEKAKNSILSVIDCFEPTSKKHSDGNNPPISTFGLIPVCQSMPLEEAIKIATKTNIIKPKSISKSNLQLIGKNLSLCIIVLNRVVKNPIEFSIWHLFLDEKLLSVSGINQQTISRFMTIFKPHEIEKKSDTKLLNKTKKVNKVKVSKNNIKKATVKHSFSWNFDIEWYGIDYDNAKSFIILDTLDTLTYRILMPWKPATLDTNLILPKYRISPIFEQYIQNIKISSRIDNYNKLVIANAQNYMFLNNIVNIEKIEKIASIHESKYLKNTIYHELKQVFSDLINTYKPLKKSKISSKIITKIDFSDIIHHYKIYDKFAEIILNNYTDYLESNRLVLEKLDFSVSEILITFITYLDNLIVEFKKEIHSQYNKIESTIGNNENYPLQSIFDDILLHALNTIITDETNIYQSALKKYQLLSLN